MQINKQSKEIGILDIKFLFLKSNLKYGDKYINSLSKVLKNND